MGRKRYKLDQHQWHDSVLVSDEHLNSIRNTQEQGTAFFGHAIYPGDAESAPIRSTFFCPLPIDPPQASAPPCFPPSEFSVEQPTHPALLNIQKQWQSNPQHPPQPLHHTPTHQLPHQYRHQQQPPRQPQPQPRPTFQGIHSLNKPRPGLAAQQVRYGLSMPSTNPTMRPPPRPQAPPKPSRRSRTPTPTSETNRAVPTTPPPTHLHGIKLTDCINCTATNKAGGDKRVKLSGLLSRAPPGFTGAQVHALHSLEGVKFYQEVAVQDSDDTKIVYKFSLLDPAHVACFNIGSTKDGDVLMSWSNLYALYELPDGTKWAEHGYFNDADDLQQLGQRLGKDHKGLLPSDMHEQELLRRQGRYHSRLHNIEFEAWVFEGQLPEYAEEEPENHTNVYFWRYGFSPYTLERVDLKGVK